MSDTGLPSGWEIRHSNSRNLPYYYNASVLQSRWDPPEGTDTERLKAYLVQGGQTTEKIRASHLLVKHAESRRPSSWREAEITRSKEEAFTRIRQFEERLQDKTAELSELARTESDCSSAMKGGDLGPFGRGEMQREFEEAAFALQPGELSHIVETASGLHIIQRTDDGTGTGNLFSSSSAGGGTAAAPPSEATSANPSSMTKAPTA